MLNIFTLKKIFTIIFLLINFSAHSQFLKEWIRSDDSLMNSIRNSAVDSLGNFYTLRDLSTTQNGHSILYSRIEKYDPQGVSVWKKNFPEYVFNITTFNLSFHPEDLQIDYDGNLVALMCHVNQNLTWLYKMDLDGNVIWQDTFPEEYHALIIDSNNTIYALEYSNGLSFRKMNSNGELIWNHVIQHTGGNNNGAVLLNNELFVSEYDFDSSTVYLNKIDSSGNESNLFSIPCTTCPRLLGIENNELYFDSYHAYEVRDFSGNILLSNSFTNDYNSLAGKDPLNNWWFSSEQYNAGEIEFKKYNSSHVLVFNQTFYLPNSDLYTSGFNKRHPYFINNELYIPYAYTNMISHNEYAGILRVDQSGNIFSQGEFLLNSGCNFDIGPMTHAFFESNNKRYVYVALNEGCPTSDNTFHIAKFSFDGYAYRGNFFEDLNANTVYDSLTEYGIAMQRLKVLPDSSYYFSNSLGNYEITIDASSPRIFQYDNFTGGTITTDSLAYHITPGISDPCCYNFGLTGNPIAHDIHCDFTSADMQCDSNNVYWISFYNQSSVPEHLVASFTFDTLTTFVSSTDTIALQNGNTVTWQPVTLFPFQSFQTTAILSMPGAAYINDTMSFHLEVKDALSGLVLCSKDDYSFVSCSFDPNDKQVRPEGIGPVHLTSANELTYTIRFQNTGNTTAHRIQLIDTLSPDLDLNSFRIISYSHPAEVNITGRILKVLFENIHLPDSGSDFAGSQGFFKYSVRPKNNLSLPVVVSNTAAIYFDFNQPVITNEVFNTLYEIPNSIQSQSENKLVTVYPNPVSDKLYLSDGKNLTGKNFTFSMIDVQGKIIRKSSLSKLPSYFDCSDLNNGVYILRIESDSSVFNLRFVKLTQ